MTTKACKRSGRKHTPITSRRQERFFYSELNRKKKGQGKTEMNVAELKRHIKEAKGKSLPARARRKR